MAPTNRISYTYEFKYRVLLEVAKGTKRSDIIRNYGISSSTLSNWIKDKSTIFAKNKCVLGEVKPLVNVVLLPGESYTPKELRCQLATKMYTLIGTPAMSHIDRELTPILAEIMTLKPGNDQHTSVRQLFHWLVDPRRTVEEFNYVIGPLERHVNGIMRKHFWHIVKGVGRSGRKYLAKVAAEALVIMCPVLEGPWEVAAGFVLNLHRYFRSIYRDDLGVVSDLVSTWVITMIGNPDLCPSPYLRIELVKFLFMMVDLNEYNWTLAFESVMSAWSFLDLDCITGCCFKNCNNEWFHGYLDHNMANISRCLEQFTQPEGHLFRFDEKLAARLKDHLNSRQSNVLHDVSCYHSFNSSRSTEPIELHSLTALLHTANKFIQKEFLKFQRWGIYIDNGQWCEPDKLSHSIYMIFGSFKRTMQTPQLVELAASCVMGLVELILLVNVALLVDRDERGDMYPSSLKKTNAILEQVLDFKLINGTISTSSIGTKLVSKDYIKRIRYLKENVHDIYLDQFPMIYKLFDYVNGHSDPYFFY